MAGRVVDNTWTVRAVDDLADDILEKAAVFLQSFLAEAADPVWSADYFRWKLGEANPAGRGFMTVAVYNGDVIGVTTITRKRMWDGQEQVAAAEIGDTYSHPDFRRKGRAMHPYPQTGESDEYLSRSVFGRLVTETQERAEAAGISLIYGTPNANSMPGYTKRLRFFDYESHYNQLFVRPGSAAIVRRWPTLQPLQTLLYSLERPYAKASRRLFNSRGRWHVQEIQEVGDEINAWWQRLRTQNRFGLLRDAAYFRHRFLQNPLARYRVWAVHQAGAICGVFVTRTMTRADGRRVCYLADWLIDQSVPGIFRFVVAHMIAENVDRGIEAYAFWGERNWAGSQGLSSLGCLRKNRVPIIFYEHQDSRRLEAAHPVLDFTLATSDNV